MVDSLYKKFFFCKHSKIRLVASVLCAVALFCSGVYLYGLNKYKNEIKSMSISDIDIKSVPDGVYEGDCDVGYIYAKVSVTVADGSIKNITLLKHDNDRGEAAKAVLPEIVAEQRIDVDVIASATNSSQTIKKAVENALLAAKK